MHGLRTTFQYFAESFDGGKAALGMRHLFLYFFFGMHFRIFVRKFLVHLRMVYASLQKLARPCSSPPPLDRVLHEVALHESIRCAPGDHVEQWLNSATLPGRRGTAHLGLPLARKLRLVSFLLGFYFGGFGTPGKYCTYLTSLPLVSVRHHGRVNSQRVNINFTSSASFICLVHNLCCEKYINERI